MEGACDLVMYSYEELKSITGEFSTENFVGNSHFGKLFKGQIQDGEEVMVKIWVEDSPTKAASPELQQSRFEKEIQLLTKPDIRSHPNLVKLMGYCDENGHLGVVYKQKPLNTLLNILFRDDFKWFDRVKVAFRLAFLLKQFHDQGLWLRDIDAAYILVDQAFDPILFDFSTLVGGDFGDIPPSEQKMPEFWDYFPRHTIDVHILMTGQWTVKADVFAFGVLLLNLFAKKVYDPEVDRYSFFGWALTEYKKRKFGSLVDSSSFETDPLFDEADALKITKLAMECMHERVRLRPSMDDVIDRLHELDVVQIYSHMLRMPEVCPRIRGDTPSSSSVVPVPPSLLKRKIKKYLQRFL